MPQFPDHWSADARDLYDEVLAERPDLKGAEHGALIHACELTAAADALAGVAREAGFMAPGSRQQPRLHAATVEARLSRTAAATILARIVPTKGARATEKARAAARTRWAGRTP